MFEQAAKASAAAAIARYLVAFIVIFIYDLTIRHVQFHIVVFIILKVIYVDSDRHGLCDEVGHGDVLAFLFFGNDVVRIDFRVRISLWIAVIVNIRRMLVAVHLTQGIGAEVWRVDTLSDLSSDNSISPSAQRDNCLSECSAMPPCKAQNPSPEGEASHIGQLPTIGQLLAKHCEDAQLYLQTDLTLSQLSAAIGVNRYYLSQYFASQGTSYYEYIHDLRIRHFVARYRELAAAQKPIVAQQLAQESGYHSYSTFSAAFKRRMHKSVTAWIHEEVLIFTS